MSESAPDPAHVPSPATPRQAAAQQAARETIKLAFMVGGLVLVATAERLASRPDAARELRMRASRAAQAWAHAAAELAHTAGGMLHTAGLKASAQYRRDCADG
jgi:hypothetical protein